MTREQKLALILGFALTLAVTVLISDHFSSARQEQFGEIAVNTSLQQTQTPHARVGFDNPSENVLPTEPVVEDPAPKWADSGKPRTIRNDESLPDTIARLLVGEPETLVEPARQPETPQSPPRTPEVQEQAPRRHQIARGDTLWSIADTYYGDPALRDALADYNIQRNFLKDRNVIRLGATILIPDRAALGAGGANPPRQDTTPSRKEPTFRSYTIQKGDTAWGIAQKLLGDGKRHKEITDLNSSLIPNPDRLPVGVTIRIPG